LRLFARFSATISDEKKLSIAALSQTLPAAAQVSSVEMYQCNTTFEI
jgi:hypothetical protein